MKKTILIISLSIVITFVISTIKAQAGQVLGVDMIHTTTIETGSLKVGEQGVGGVTFFNGTIVNATSTDGVDNPVTFGDNVRIDGTIQRGDEAGPGDGFPVKFNDDVEIAGTLTVNGKKISAAKDFTAQIQGLQGDITLINATNSNQGKRLDTVDATNTAQGKRLDAIESTNKSQANRLDDIEGLNATQSTDIAAVETAVEDNRAYIRSMQQYLNCVAESSQYTIYLESSDTIYCWNTWMAGTPIAQLIDFTSINPNPEIEKFQSVPTTAPR
jgi:hypothetical protein